MKVLVTGATGLVGAHVVRSLIENEHEVRTLVRPTSDLAALEGLPVELFRGDVLDRQSLGDAVDGCCWMFHAAAIFAYAGDATKNLQRTAVEGTANVLSTAAERGVERVILTSSSVVFGYGNGEELRDESSPIETGRNESSYVAAKVLQDRTARELSAQLGIDLVIVCPTLTIGPFQPVLGPSNAMILAYLRDPFRVTFCGGCNLVSAEDVGRAHVIAATQGRSGQHYLAGAENLEWSCVHQMISELCGVEGPHLNASQTACYVGGLTEEALAWAGGRTPVATREQSKMVGRYYWYRHGRLSELGYAPGPARRALATAIAWLASSSHVSRELRAGLQLAPEVYEARRALSEREAGLRSRS